MKRVWISIVVFAVSGFGCLDGQEPIIVAHRAQGVGFPGENIPENVPLAFASGFGAEIDVRGDGEKLMELGHLAPEGRELSEVFAAVRDRWEPSFAGRMLIIDVANDTGDRVSENLIDVVCAEVVGTPLEELDLVIESSNLETLARMHAIYSRTPSGLRVRFSKTYWNAPEYTVPAWVDTVSVNIAELPSFSHPHSILVFGVSSRNAYRQVVHSRSTIEAIITEHPHRVASW